MERYGITSIRTYDAGERANPSMPAVVDKQAAGAIGGTDRRRKELNDCD